MSSPTERSGDAWRGPLSGAPLGLPQDAGGLADEDFGVPERSRYERGGLIGRGGMGEIRASHDRRLARTVAVKTASVRSEVAARRLVAEAQLTARLVHPGIIAVHGAGRSAEGEPYYTMPVVRGRSLGQAIADAAPGERPRLVRHFLDACNAVAYAHSEGVVHRDLKPSNIMVGLFGETVVVDWGLAATAGEVVDAPVGTEQYMAPEQRGRHAVHPPADVFALGVSLRELLTGAPDGSLAPPVAPELAAVVRKATRANPAERYLDGAALASDVAAWFEGRQVGAHRYSLGEVVARVWAVHRIPLLAVLLAILGIAGATAIGVVQTGRAHRRAVASAQEALAAAQTAEENLAHAQVASARMAAGSERWADAELLAADALTRIASPVARGVLARMDPDARPQLVRRHSLARCSRLAVSPSGAWLACARESRIRVGPTLSDFTEGPTLITRGDPLTILPGGAVVIDSATLGLTVEDDGDRFVLEPPGARRLQGHAHPMQALSWNRGATERWADLGERVASSTEVCIEQGSSVPAVTAVRNDGLRVVLCQDGGLFTAAASAFTKLMHLPGTLGAPLQLAFAPRGPKVGVTVAAGGAVLLDLSRGELIHHFKSAGTPADLAISSRHVALSDGRGAVEVWALDAKTRVARLGAERARLRWLADGETLRIVTDDTVEDWAMPQTVRPHIIEADSGIASLSISPDGRRLLTAHGNGTVRLSSTDGTMTPTTVPLHWSVAKDVEFSPDGVSAVATCAQDSALHRIETHGPVAVNTRAARPGTRVAWLASGRILTVPYTGGLQLWSPGRDAPRYVIDRTIRVVDLETEADRRAVTSVDVDGRIERIVDTVAPVRAHWIATRPGATGAASNAGTTAVLVPEGLEVFPRDGGSSTVARLGSEATDVAVSADGTTIAVGHHDGRVSVIGAGTLETLATLPGHAGRVAALAFDRDGAWLLSGSWDGDVRQWSMANLRRDARTLRAEIEAQWGRPASSALQRSAISPQVP